MSILLDRVDEERIKLDLTGAGLELSKAWNKMLEKVKKPFFFLYVEMISPIEYIHTPLFFHFVDFKCLFSLHSI